MYTIDSNHKDKTKLKIFMYLTINYTFNIKTYLNRIRYILCI